MYELGELLLAIATSASFHTCAYVRQAGFLLVDSRVLRPAALHASVSSASFCAPRYSRFAAVTWFPTCIYRGSSFLIAFPLAVNEPVSLGSPIRAPPPLPMATRPQARQRVIFRAGGGGVVPTPHAPVEGPAAGGGGDGDVAGGAGGVGGGLGGGGGGGRVAPPPGGTRTITLTLSAPGDGNPADGLPAPILRLRRRPRRRRVTWTADTHDNEFDDKKSSKSCCIYVKPRAFDESSTDDSDGEDDSGGDSDGSSGSSSSSSGGPVRVSRARRAHMERGQRHAGEAEGSCSHHGHGDGGHGHGTGR